MLLSHAAGQYLPFQVSFNEALDDVLQLTLLAELVLHLANYLEHIVKRDISLQSGTENLELLEDTDCPGEVVLVDRQELVTGRGLLENGG